jgi:hypothetical protein
LWPYFATRIHRAITVEEVEEREALRVVSPSPFSMISSRLEDDIKIDESEETSGSLISSSSSKSSNSEFFGAGDEDKSDDSDDSDDAFSNVSANKSANFASLSSSSGSRVENPPLFPPSTPRQREEALEELENV